MLNLIFTCLRSAQMEVTGGQMRARGWPEKVILDPMAVVVEGLSGKCAQERRNRLKPEFCGLCTYGGQLRVGSGPAEGGVGD